MSKGRVHPKGKGNAKNPFKRAPMQEEGKTHTKTPKVMRGKAIHYHPKVRM